MFEQYSIQVSYKNRERQILNALLALATGCLTLIYPNFLYLIAGGYLVALGVLFMAFRISPTLSAIPIVAGIVIFIFPELIPVTFAAFLGLFGIILLFGFQFAILGVITLIIALLIVMYPGSIAYFIATFLLIYSVSNLIRLYQDRKHQST
jgi:membrane-associated HD superfamily phosphohydrolase